MGSSVRPETTILPTDFIFTFKEPLGAYPRDLFDTRKWRALLIEDFFDKIPVDIEINKLMTHTPLVAGNFRVLNCTSIDVNCRNWNENIATWVNTGGGNNNNTWQWGYNNAFGGGREDVTEGAFYVQVESNFNPAATPHVPTFEYHLNAYTAAGVAIGRPFQYNVARAGDWIETSYRFNKISWINHTDGLQSLILSPGVLDLANSTYIRNDLNGVAFLKQLNNAAAFIDLLYLDAGNVARLDGAVGGIRATVGAFDQSDNAAAIPVLVLDQADISEGFINFIGSDRGVIAGATSSAVSVRVELGGVVYRLALYADA